MEHQQPGDSSRDLLIPKRRRSLNQLWKGHVFTHHPKKVTAAWITRNSKQPVEVGSLPHYLHGFSTIQTVVNRLGISAIQQHPRGEGLVSRSGRWMPRHLLDGHEVEPRSGPSPNVYRNTGCRSEDGRPGGEMKRRSDDGEWVKTWPLKKQKGRAWGCKFYEKITSKHCKLRCFMAPTCLKPR